MQQPEGLDPTCVPALLAQVRDCILAQAQCDVPPSADAQRIAKRLSEYGAAYFEFIITPKLEPAIRFVIIDLHITQGTHGENGCRWSERI